MSNAIVVYLRDSGSSSTIQYPLLKSAIVNLVMPWNLVMISSMDRGCSMVPSPKLHLSPWDRGKFVISCPIDFWRHLESFFSMITKLFTHSVTSLVSSRIPNFSRLRISRWKASCKCIGTFLGACLAGFALSFSWNLYGGPGNFPIPVKTSEYT